MKRIVCSGLVAVFAGIVTAMDADRSVEQLANKYVAATYIRQKETDDMNRVENVARNTWNIFKVAVMSEDESNFDKFLCVVFMGKYHDGVCFNAPLLRYRSLLAKFYVDEINNIFASLSNDKKKQREVAQKVFLVCFAARSTLPSSFDNSEMGHELNETWKSMFLQAFSPESYSSTALTELRTKLERQKSEVPVGVAVRFYAAYSYAKKHGLLLQNILWRYFYENKVVKKWNP